MMLRSATAVLEEGRACWVVVVGLAVLVDEGVAVLVCTTCIMYRYTVKWSVVFKQLLCGFHIHA